MELGMEVQLSLSLAKEDCYDLGEEPQDVILLQPIGAARLQGRFSQASSVGSPTGSELESGIMSSPTSPAFTQRHPSLVRRSFSHSDERFI